MPSSLPAALHDPFGLVGTLLEGQYRVDAIVGEGGFGVVYRGRHLGLDQPIAIKVLKGLDGGEPRINALVLEKFRAEARLLYTLSQSSLHIVRSLDFGATATPSGAWAPFMILEWLEGRSLADDLRERRSRGLRGRSLTDALTLLEPIVEALSIAHRQHVAHRDVKPANVFLLDAAANGPKVKVLDFGIAKIMKEGEEAGTRGTLVSFTWLYAAPEQLDPRIGKTGLATDVHALALMLTELLTDKKPADERDVVAIMKAATDPVNRPTPRSRGANVPDDLEAACRRALAVDPRERFASVDELWTAIVRTRDLARGVTTISPGRSEGGTAALPPIASRALALPPAPEGRPAPSGPGAPASVAFTHVPSSPRVAVAASAPASALSPPIGTHPPGLVTTGPQTGLAQRPAPWLASPPPGTRPPGPLPAGRPGDDGALPVIVVGFVLFVLVVLFVGSCAILHEACATAEPARLQPSGQVVCTASPDNITSRM